MKNIIAIIVFAVVVASLVLYIVTNGAHANLNGSMTLAVSLVACITQIGAVGLFLYGLRSFKKGLKVSYSLVLLGTVFLSLVQTIYPFVLVAKLGAGWEWLSFVSLFFYVSSAVLVYLGMRHFARLIGVRNIWTIWWFVGLLAIGAAIVVSPFYPEAGIPQIVAWSLVFSTAAVGVLVRIMYSLGESYTIAMQRLIAAVTVFAFSALHLMVTTFIWPKGDVIYFQYGINLWPYALDSILFVIAGQAFIKSNRDAATALSSNTDYIDAVTSTSMLASNPSAIDPTLDRMRVITSRDSTDKLTTDDKRVLIEVYLEIEDYLVNKEPLRKLSREDIRSRLTYDFQHQLKGL